MLTIKQHVTDNPTTVMVADYATLQDTRFEATGTEYGRVLFTRSPFVIVESEHATIKNCEFIGAGIVIKSVLT